VFHGGYVNILLSMPVNLWRRNMKVIDKLFKRQMTTAESEQYYVRGSGLIRIPVARLNEIPKVIQEFHQREAVKMRLAMIPKH